MSFGVFVVAVDIVRVSYLENAFIARLQQTGRSASASTTRVFNDEDFALVALWSAVECEVGIICACVPALKPLVAKFIPSLLHDKIHRHSQRRTAMHDSNVSEQFKNFNMGGANDTTAQPAQRGPNDVHSPHSPTSAEQIGSGPDGIDSMDFLTTPEGYGPPAQSPMSPTSSMRQMNGAISHPASHDSGRDKRSQVSPTSAGSNKSRSNEMGFMEFLTAPDGPNTQPPTPASPSTIETNPSRLEAARKGSVAFLDFYNMKSKKPMTELTHRESIGPLALVTFLFFLWGAAYALLDQLNNAFAQVVNLDNTQVGDSLLVSQQLRRLTCFI